MTSQEAIADFMQELQECGVDMTRVRRACQRRIQDLYAAYADNTVHAVMTDYRNALRIAIRDGMLDACVLDMFRKPLEKMQERRKIQNQHLKRDLQNIRGIGDSEELLNLATSLLERSSYIDIGLGLMLLTGRRPVEIFKTGDFTLDSVPFHVIFSGQAKTRYRSKGNLSYRIPIFIEPEKAIQALHTIRSLRDFTRVEERQVHHTLSKTLNEKFRKYFGKMLPGCKPTNLRSLYATLAHETFAPENHAFNSYAADILGHDDEDTATARSYEDFYLTR